MRLIIARVTEVLEPKDGAQRVMVQSHLDSKPHPYAAVGYSALSTPCKVGDEVLINTTAVDLGLGTGGVCFVVANLSVVDRGGLDAVAFDDGVQGGGHIMKLRYTPLQHEVNAVEEAISPHHDDLIDACSLEGTPVVCCELHSQMPLVAAAVKHLREDARVVYCMSDEAALLAPFSKLLAQARRAGLIDASISCGQALGGDLEAVNLYSGMLAAYVARKADVIICAQGPGIVGTATRFGHGGMAQAQALNAAASLAGVPIAPLRLSFADRRPRHQGVSHHTLTVLGQACLAEAVIPLPSDLSDEQAATVEKQLVEAGIPDRHGLVKIPVDFAGIDLRGLKVTTMERRQSDDPAFFSAAFAAGLFAASLLDERTRA
jgi:hypothetical protein